ncbi:uncharacterized protein PHACADRAFT_30539 [Phanerochaete carnosa HHB-10118-sp]|uniref:Uncharacterized protein n=1 Tax=Phanerochaete carnosa (strain HHB-10118-sp) TaxID=650164 RepID=K5W3Q5_PHACS|nr:uncharacterized protein PHACADRAFT_30539 [Phanerochaete carnosa HHB-10118-sp]EKM53559.1 hypothetical protein PHACADRAFT_30539 [Phanerochaete carnosa HHB-10118-sp]
MRSPAGMPSLDGVLISQFAVLTLSENRRLARADMSTDPGSGFQQSRVDTGGSGGGGRRADMHVLLRFKRCCVDNNGSSQVEADASLSNEVRDNRSPLAMIQVYDLHVATSRRLPTVQNACRGHLGGAGQVAIVPASVIVRFHAAVMTRPRTIYGYTTGHPAGILVLDAYNKGAVHPKEEGEKRTALSLASRIVSPLALEASVNMADDLLRVT